MIYQSPPSVKGRDTHHLISYEVYESREDQKVTAKTEIVTGKQGCPKES
jgi:hypothetical protein